MVRILPRLLVSPFCITDLTSPYDSLSPSLATLGFLVFLSMLTDLSPCPASIFGALLSVAGLRPKRVVLPQANLFLLI